MKEIKFRAWDTRRLIFSKVFDIFSIDRDDSYRTYIPGLGKACEEDIIINQYIGLKDINDREIFENDIVIYNGEKCIIKYEEEQVAFISISIIEPEMGYSLWKDDEIEVIGNKYENPEMLQE